MTRRKKRRLKRGFVPTCSACVYGRQMPIIACLSQWSALFHIRFIWDNHFGELTRSVAKLGLQLFSRNTFTSFFAKIKYTKNSSALHTFAFSAERFYSRQSRSAFTYKWLNGSGEHFAGQISNQSCRCSHFESVILLNAQWLSSLSACPFVRPS